MAGRQRKDRAGTEQQERAGLYIRVSLDRSKHGRTEEIISPETQADRGRAYCAAQGWDVVMVEQDIDESGYRQHYSRRPGLMRLLEAVERGEITKIVVWKWSRLSRRLSEFTEICDRVERAHGGVVSVSEQVDTSTPAGRLIRNILASFAQFQSEELSEQIFETWLTMAKGGQRPPGRTPYGTVRTKQGLLVPNPQHYDTLQTIFRVFVETQSVAAVHRYLTERRIPSQGGAPWRITVIRQILTNPSYVGQLAWDGNIYPAAWPPLVDPDVWHRAQAILTAKPQAPRDRVDSHLLTGMMTCGCGASMGVKHYSGKSPSDHRMVYRCVDWRTQRAACDSPAIIDAAEVDQAVWDLVVHMCGRDGQAIRRLLEARPSPPDAGRRLAEIQRERARLEAQVADLFELLTDRLITREQFGERNRLYADRLAQLTREEAELQLASNRPSPAQAAADIVRAVATAHTIPARRAVLSALGCRITVSRRGVEVYLEGTRFRLQARLLGPAWHIGPDYQRLDYQGHVLTDKQIRFLRRTWTWADRRKLAARLGRSPGALRSLIWRLRQAGVLADPPSITSAAGDSS